MGAKSSSDFAKMTSSEVQPPLTSSTEDEATFVELQPVVPVEQALVVDAQSDQAAEKTAQTDKGLPSASKVPEEDYDLDL